MGIEVVAEDSKRCPNCGNYKSLEEFPKNRAPKDGRATYCKPRHNYRIEQIKQRLYGGQANFLRMRRYGIGAAELEAMIREQDGLCAICRERPAKHIDHDHETGKLRGILCFRCNRGLGKFRDDVAVLRRAIGYLRESRGDS